MTNTEALLNKIEDSGLKISYIAKAMGISREALYQKMKNKSDFKACEINVMCKLLKITSLKEKEAIFFARKVGKMPTT